MIKARILLLGGFFYPEPTGIGKYSGEMMDWLSTNGYECGVITTYPFYPFWKIQDPYTRKSFWYTQEKRTVSNGIPMKLYRCPHYVPKTPSGKTRVISDFSFFLSAFFQLFILLFQEKYDCVITVAPPFQLGLLGWLYKKIKGATFIYHIQDLQIDAAHELGMIKSKFLVKTMFGLERFILKRADHVSSISEGMIRKIKEKFDRPVISFPNWADTNFFHPILKKDSLKTEFNFSPDDKIVLYSGGIGEKQGLQTLLHCAKELSTRKDIKFVICGSGPYKQKLMLLAEEMKVPNVIFMPLQPKEKFNQFLNIASVHLVLQKAHASDLVMPSKLTTILSVGGLVLVTAEPETSLYSVISTHKMGILAEPENVASLTAGITMAVDLTHTEIKQRARQFAEEYLTLDKVVSRFFSHIIEEPDKNTAMRKSNKPLKVNALA